MKIEIEEEQIVPQIMLEDLGYALSSIEDFKQLEMLEEYQWRDLEYDLNLLRSLKTVYRHYTIHSDWANLDNYTVRLDHDLTETVWETPEDDWYGN